MIVADFSMKNGRENRNNGNQEKGKKEKEALRKSVRSQKGGRRKRPLSFCTEVEGAGATIGRRSDLIQRFNPTTWFRSSFASSPDSRKDSGSISPERGIIHETHKSCSAG